MQVENWVARLSLAQLEKFVLFDILEGSNPATCSHMHFFIFGQSQQLLKLILRTDGSESHGT